MKNPHCGSISPQRFDRIEASGSPRRKNPGHDANQRRGADSNQQAKRFQLHRNVIDICDDCRYGKADDNPEHSGYH